tara:strand:- start:584 stop:994 length:411 start_codon:yes stop_codon:yes gene_type:complete
MEKFYPLSVNQCLVVKKIIIYLKQITTLIDFPTVHPLLLNPDQAVFDPGFRKGGLYDYYYFSCKLNEVAYSSLFKINFEGEIENTVRLENTILKDIRFLNSNIMLMWNTHNNDCENLINIQLLNQSFELLLLLLLS